MDSISLAAGLHAVVPRPEAVSTVHGRSLPCSSSFFRAPASASSSVRRSQFSKSRRMDAFSFASNGSTSSVPTREGIYTVGDFMTGKEHLHAVKPTTTIDEALDILVEKRITGFPVIDDDWKLVMLDLLYFMFCLKEHLHVLRDYILWYGCDNWLNWHCIFFSTAGLKRVILGFASKSEMDSREPEAM